MNCCSGSGNTAVGGIQVHYPCGRNLHHHHYLLLLQIWSGLLCTRKGEWGMSQVMDHISTLPGKSGLWLFIFSASQEQTKTSMKTSSCYDQSLGLSLGFPHLSWCGTSRSRLPAPQTTGLSSALFVRVFQIACESGNCYWCSQLATTVAATVISALIFFKAHLLCNCSS